jgi:hypothetical protein
MFPRYSLDKKLTSRIYKDLKTLNTKEQIIQVMNGQSFQKKKFKWLINKMHKCSVSLDIKEMQIKTMLRFHLTPVRLAISKKINNKYW